MPSPPDLIAANAEPTVEPALSAGLPLRSDDPIGVGRCQRFVSPAPRACRPQGGDREIRSCAARSTIDHGVDLAVREHRTQVVGRDTPYGLPALRRWTVTTDHHPQTSAVTQLGQRAGVDLGDHPGPPRSRTTAVRSRHLLLPPTTRAVPRPQPIGDRNQPVGARGGEPATARHCCTERGITPACPNAGPRRDAARNDSPAQGRRVRGRAYESRRGACRDACRPPSL